MSKVRNIVSAPTVAQELERIKNEARQLSGYAGSDYPDSAGYDDDGDDFGYAKPKKPTLREAAQTFKFRLVNKGSAPLDRRIAILPGLMDNETEMNAQGFNVAGILRDGQVVPGAVVGTNDVVLTGLRKQTWKMLKKFIDRNPARLIGFSISSDNVDMYETEIVVKPSSAFSDQGEKIIDLSEYYSPDQFSAKKAEVDLINDNNDFSFDEQNTAIMTLLAGTSCTITLRFAGIDNAAKKFDQRARQGRDNSTAKALAMGSRKSFRK